MDFIKVQLGHRDLINSYLKKQRIDSSELTFSTIYIWREAFNMRFAISNDCLIISSKDNGYPASLRFPLGDGNKSAAIFEACNHFLEIGETPKFYGLTKSMVDELQNICQDRFEITRMNNYDDYVYKSEKLINLSGKKLHSKKNHLNKFMREYSYEYSPITSADAHMITSEYDNWFSDDDFYLLSERQSIADILNNFEYLGLSGGKITVNDKLCAFSIGEKLNDNTAVIHIEKANTDFNGSYAAINQMFVKNCWSEFEYINREEDVGLEGLRQAKQSYQPDFMVEKYKAVLKGENV